ncbi:response regulator [Orrella daihaiensis]|uniref:Response regulator transcription factor n=1 Tax=Orrella daihaiensis TaxID=2782176 RepID=A0ABY4ALY9_9BURK|nr:response regulator transcription factor [Orrella daihaiensis]UOD51298.1 response regulator transcription factor [Orrella daihaiensis]
MSPLSATSSSNTACNVLVVEDDRFFQQAIKKGLSMVLPRCHVAVFPSTFLAMQSMPAGASPYQMAIVDLELPDGDGVDIIRYLVKHHPDTPIMVLTVANNERRVLEAVRAGATGYVVKGDVSLSITKALEQLISGLHPISPSLAGYFLKLAGRESLGSGENPIERLTPRELHLLREFAAGKSYREAAESMNISITTVRTHTTNLYRKLGVRSGLRALSVAKEHGLI